MAPQRFLCSAAGGRAPIPHHPWPHPWRSPSVGPGAPVVTGGCDFFLGWGLWLGTCITAATQSKVFPGTVPRCRGSPLRGPCGHPPQGSPSRRWVPKLPKVNYLLVPDLAAMMVLETGN